VSVNRVLNFAGERCRDVAQTMEGNRFVPPDHADGAAILLWLALEQKQAFATFSSDLVFDSNRRLLPEKHAVAPAIAYRKHSSHGRDGPATSLINNAPVLSFVTKATFLASFLRNAGVCHPFGFIRYRVSAYPRSRTANTTPTC